MRKLLLGAMLLAPSCSEDKLRQHEEPIDECRRIARGELVRNPACAPEPNPLEPVLEWHWEPSGDNANFRSFLGNPVVVQLNDDNGDTIIDANDVPDIVVVGYAGTDSRSAVMFALSGNNSHTLWEVSGLNGNTVPAAGDLDDDGIVEIVTVTDYLDERRVIVLEHDGTEKWRSGVTQAGPIASIADLNSDGFPEILFANHVLDHTGQLLWTTGQTIYAHKAMVAADLNNDGFLECFDGQRLYTYDGELIWTAENPGSSAAIGDVDLDGKPDVVIGGESARALKGETGEVIWSQPFSAWGPPTIADFDGDGEPEVAIAGLTKLRVLDGNGTIMWSQDITDGSSGALGITAFDFEGDGRTELLLADELEARIFAGATGALRAQLPDHASATLSEHPVVVDVDGDGETEIVVVHSQGYHGEVSNHYGVSVYGPGEQVWMPAKKIWNEFNYYLSNVNDDGTIPAAVEPHWTTHNSYRSAQLTQVPLDDGMPELVPAIVEVCDATCTDGVTLTLQIGNQGYPTVQGQAKVEVIVQRQGDWEVVDSRVVDLDLPPGGWSPAIRFSGLDFDLRGVTDFGVQIDEGPDVTGAHLECDEENNRVTVGRAPCYALGQ